MIVPDYLKRLYRREFEIENQVKELSKTKDFPDLQSSKNHDSVKLAAEFDLITIRKDIEVYIKLHQDKAS